MLRVNLGGEGEIPGVINQQPEWVANELNKTISRGGKTFTQLIAEGHQFVFGPNENLPFEDGSVEIVYTNNVEYNGLSYLKRPWVPESEIWRIMTDGGVWYHNGSPMWVKLWVASPI